MAAEKIEIIHKYKITHVLSICEEVSRKKNVIYKHVNIWDTQCQDIKKYFPECLEYIEQSIQEGGTVLVHCMAGISRSATIVIAYMMKEHNLSFGAAIRFVK